MISSRACGSCSMKPSRPGSAARLRGDAARRLRGYYSVVANPFLWFLQHQMYALPYEPNVDRPPDGGLADRLPAGEPPPRRRCGRGGRRTSSDRCSCSRTTTSTSRPSRSGERRPDATILHFTHIPWPPAGIWQMIPQSLRRAICEGLLAADIVGLQTDRYAAHFLDTVASFVRDARVDRDGRTVRWRGRRIRVRSYPISVDPGRAGAFRGLACGRGARRADPRAPGACREPDAHRPRRPDRAVEERAARLPRVRGPHRAPARPLRRGALPRGAGGDAVVAAGVRRATRRPSARSSLASTGCAIPTNSRSGSTTGPTTRWRSPRSASPTWCSSTRSSTA